MARHKPAPRRVEFDFLGQAKTKHPEKYRLKIDANRIHSWRVAYDDNEPETSLGIVFEDRYAKLGSVMVDMIDYGEHLGKTLNDMIYEARHPWLDVNDAKKKKVFNIKAVSENMLLRAKDGRYFTISESSLADTPINPYWVAFKPIHPDWHRRYTHIEAWEG